MEWIWPFVFAMAGPDGTQYAMGVGVRLIGTTVGLFGR